MNKKPNNVIPFPLEKCRVPVVKKPLPVVQTWRKGQAVNHPKFGRGVIVSYEKPPLGNENVEVNFKNVGVKRLMLAYAKLEKL